MNYVLIAVLVLFVWSFLSFFFKYHPFVGYENLENCFFEARRSLAKLQVFFSILDGYVAARFAFVSCRVSTFLILFAYPCLCHPLPLTLHGNTPSHTSVINVRSATFFHWNSIEIFTNVGSRQGNGEIELCRWCWKGAISDARWLAKSEAKSECFLKCSKAMLYDFQTAECKGRKIDHRSNKYMRKKTCHGRNRG